MPSSFAWADEMVLPFSKEELAPFDRGRLAPALRAARVARRMTLEDVAAETRIGMRHLEAIEDSRFGGFPGAIYAIGFARAFARSVGLDERWAADAMRQELARTA